jgi:hypothetical protein
MNPIRSKVKAATATSAVAGAVIWILGKYVFKGSTVPDVFVQDTYVLVPAIFAFIGGYLKKETAFPTPPVLPAPQPVGSVLRVPVPAAQSGTMYGSSGIIPPQLGGTVTQAQPEQVPMEPEQPPPV